MYKDDLAGMFMATSFHNNKVWEPIKMTVLGHKLIIVYLYCK